MRPRLIFATHHKCASSYLERVISRYSAGVKCEFTAIHGAAGENVPDCDILFARNAEIEFCGNLPGVVHIIRNPLDLLVSAYYSHLSTHPLDLADWPELLIQRDILSKLNRPDGFAATWAFLERADFHKSAVGPLYALRRWDHSVEMKTLLMEDLTRRPLEILSNCGLERSTLSSALEGMDFHSLSGGRAVGEIDNASHYRSGRRNQWMSELSFGLATGLSKTYHGIIEKYYSDSSGELFQ